MATQQLINGHRDRYLEARSVLEQRGLQPDNDVYNARQLARELARRGWRWDLGGDQTRATKAFVPPGVAPQTFVAEGADQSETLAIVLADAIRYDEEHGLSPSPRFRADIALRTPDNQLVAVVEVKNRMHLTSDIASQFRRNLIADARLDSRTPFILFLSQDVGFLWDQDSNGAPSAQPSREFPMESVVTHYAGSVRQHERLTGGELEPIVALWMIDLANDHPGRPKEADAFFEGTRFVELIRDATIDTHALV